MGRRIHVCQSVEGALMHWDFNQWHAVAKDNKMSVNEVKRWFLQCVREGKKVIPLHEECEGFSYETGCPGHDTTPTRSGTECVTKGNEGK